MNPARELLQHAQTHLQTHCLWDSIQVWQFANLEAFKHNRNRILALLGFQSKAKSKDEDVNRVCVDLLSMLLCYLRNYPELGDMIKNASNHKHGSRRSRQTMLKTHLTRINRILDYLYDLFDPTSFVVVFPEDQPHRPLDWSGAQYNSQLIAHLLHLQHQWESRWNQAGGSHQDGEGGNEDEGKWRGRVTKEQYQWCRFVYQHINLQKRQKKQNQQMPTNSHNSSSTSCSSSLYKFDPFSSYESPYHLLQQQLLVQTDSQIHRNLSCCLIKTSVLWIDTPQFNNDPCCRQLAELAQHGYLVFTWNFRAFDLVPDGVFLFGIHLGLLGQVVDLQGRLEQIEDGQEGQEGEVEVDRILDQLGDTIDQLEKELHKTDVYVYHSTNRHRLHQLAINFHLESLRSLQLREKEIQRIGHLNFNILHPETMNIVMARFLLFQAIGIKSVTTGQEFWPSWQKVNMQYRLSVGVEGTNQSILVPQWWQQILQNTLPFPHKLPPLPKNQKPIPPKTPQTDIQKTDQKSTKCTSGKARPQKRDCLEISNISRNLFGVIKHNNNKVVCIYRNQYPDQEEDQISEASRHS